MAMARELLGLARMRRLGCAAMLFLAACAGGSDDGGDVDAAPQADAAGFPDAGPQADAAEQADAAPMVDAAPVLTGCEKLGAPVHTATTYPDTFAGNVNSSNATLEVTDGDCAAEEAPFGVSAPGPEQVIQLDNLVEGTTYGILLTAGYDTNFYVVTGCSGGTGFSAGECLAYVDAEDTVERGLFVAPAGGTAYVVVDYYDTDAISDGSFSLTVVEDPECDDDYDCNATNPVCDTSTLTCIAGYDVCVDDDASENGDDGPMGGTQVNLVLGAPVAIAASICSDPETEFDWYRFTAAEGDEVTISLTWDESEELDLYVYDAAMAEVDYLYAYSSGDALYLIDLAAGDYYVQLLRYSSVSSAVTDYTITFSVPECAWSGDCAAGEPVCLYDQTCAPAQTACTDVVGDDGDDGASVAPQITGNPATTSSAICSAPIGSSWFGGVDYSMEEDWYRINVAAGRTLTAALDWVASASGEDLDLYLFDGEGNLLDAAAATGSVGPETVVYDNLEATTQTWYLAIHYWSPTDDAAGVNYTLTTTKQVTP
jgi:hypothetical protein